MTSTITKTKLLLVEGQDEVGFIRALLDVIGMDDIELWDAKGKTNLRQALMAVRLVPGFESVTSIGVIRDADEDAKAAFDSVVAHLKAQGYPVPQQVGTSAVKDGLAASVFIFPGGEAPGMLETLVWKSIENHAIATEVAEFITRCRDILPAEIEDEVRTAGPAGWRKPRGPDKARMQALLATMIEAKPRVGIAAQKGYFDLTDATFAAFCDYLKAL
jgi:hypothetical protein